MIIKKAGIIKDGRSHGEQLEDGADAPEKGGIGGDGGSSSLGEAGGLPQFRDREAYGDA